MTPTTTSTIPPISTNPPKTGEIAGICLVSMRLNAPGSDSEFTTCVGAALIRKRHDAEKDEGDTDVDYWFSIHKNLSLSSKSKRLNNSRPRRTIDPCRQGSASHNYLDRPSISVREPGNPTGSVVKDAQRSCKPRPHFNQSFLKGLGFSPCLDRLLRCADSKGIAV